MNGAVTNCYYVSLEDESLDYDFLAILGGGIQRVWFLMYIVN
jgi:hypothetical protein